MTLNDVRDIVHRRAGQIRREGDSIIRLALDDSRHLEFYGHPGSVFPVCTLPHNHEGDAVNRVLAGRMVNTMYDEAPGDEYQVYIGPPFTPTDRRTGLTAALATTHAPNGVPLWLPVAAIHVATFHEATILLAHRGASKRRQSVYLPAAVQEADVEDAQAAVEATPWQQLDAIMEVIR